MHLTTREEYVEIRNLIEKIKNNKIFILKQKEMESNTGISVLEKLKRWFKANSYESLVFLELEYDEWNIWFERLLYNILELDNCLNSNSSIAKLNIRMSKINSDYQRLQSLENAFEKRSLELQERKNNISNKTHDLEVSLNELKGQYERIRDNIDNLERDCEAILKIEKQNYDDKLKEFQDSYVLSVKSVIQNFDEDKDNMFSKLEQLRTEVEETLRNFENNINREELAQFFLDERMHMKKDLSLSKKGFSNIFTPYWLWLIATFIGMVMIAGFALYTFYTDTGSDWHTMLPRMPLFAILIWFTWFCSKQFSYTKQVCDEYEYKYALSKSYLSYRDEANKLSEKAGRDVLLASLLDAVIKNIASSPVQSVRQDCHTPFAEALKAFEPIAKKAGGEEKK